MPNGNTGGVSEMDEWQNRVQQDITELKQDMSQVKANQTSFKADITKLEFSDQMQAQEISALKESLGEIKEDTNWIRRKITGAIITATITAVIAGVIGIAIANIF